MKTHAKSRKLLTAGGGKHKRTAVPPHPGAHLQQRIGNQGMRQIVDRPYPNEGCANVIAARLAPELKAHANSKNIVFGAAFGHSLNRSPIHHPPLQRKPIISSPDDEFEREADVMADTAIRMAEPAPSNTAPAAIQRRRKECECEEEQCVQTNPVPGADGVAALDVEAAVHAAGRDGVSLPGDVRSYFESRFGYDFSAVRVHTGNNAAEGAQAIQARAYTIGRDIMFGSSEYAPATVEGKRLLAHELAHVVQQHSGDAGPLIRPRLLVTADAGDIKALFGLLEPASGLKLKADPIKGDPKTKQVTGKVSVSMPPSPTLASELKTITEDPQQDAELNLGRTQAGVFVGSFPMSQLRFPPEEGKPEHLVQEIRIDQLVALEKGAPGSGVESLVHEMTENFHAHSPALLQNVRKGPMSAEQAFNESHREAIKQEERVIAELKHPGKRHSLFQVLMGKEPHQFFRAVQDMEQYFIVWESAFGGGGGFSNVRRVPPIQVSTYDIKGFDAAPTSGKKSLPLSDIIRSTSRDLRNNPTASARIKVLLSPFDVRMPTPDTPQEWAETIQRTVETELDAITPVSDRALEPRSDAEGEWTSGDQSSVIISVNRPDIP
jgi:hypothetical protein